MRGAIVMVALVACKGDDEAELPPPISLIDAAEASSVEVSFTDGDEALAATAHALGQLLDQLISDNTVRSTFYTDGNLGNAPVVAYSPCWTVPGAGVAGFEYDVDLAACASAGLAGVIHVENTSQGPVVLTFSATTILDWELTGSIAFDLQSDRTWAIYPSNTDADPGYPLSVIGPDGTVQLTIAGGMQLASNGSTYDLWGSWSDGTSTVGLGGEPAAVTGATNPAGSLEYRLMPAECACQQAGDVVVSSGIVVEGITVDLDAIEAEDDGVDDPELVFTPAGTLSGVATLSRGDACGTFAGGFSSAGGTPSITLTEADLKSGFQAACDNGAINDDGKCQRLQEAAAGATLMLSVGAPKIGDGLTEWSDDAFDDGICYTGLASTGAGGPL